MRSRTSNLTFSVLLASVCCISERGYAQDLGQLKDKDAKVRIAALEAIAKSQPAGAAAAIIPLLTDKDAGVRLTAAAALASFPADADKTVTPLAKSLKDKDAGVRIAAAMTLKSFGAAAKPAVTQLASAVLTDPQMAVKVFAADTLTLIGKDAQAASPALVTVIHLDKATSVTAGGQTFILDQAASARRALIAIGDPAVPVLIRTMKDPKLYNVNRGAAAKLLGDMFFLATYDKEGQKPVPAGMNTVVPALVKALEDPDGYVAFSAADALKKCGAHAQAGLSQALKQVKSANAAASALANEKAGGLHLVIAALKDKNPKIRQAAIFGISLTGKRASQLSEPDIAKGFFDKEAVKWAFLMKDEAVPELILILQKDPDVATRTAAANVFQDLGKIGEPAVPALVASIKQKDAKDKERKVALAAIRALSQFPTDAAIAALIEGLREPALRMDVVQSFSSIGQKAIPALMKASMDNDQQVANAAKLALFRIRGS